MIVILMKVSLSMFCRPWIVSQAKVAYKPSLYGFAIDTAFKVLLYFNAKVDRISMNIVMIAY